jgi:hypothetical protein
MYDLYYRGKRVDSYLPSYADGEVAMKLHHDIQQAHDEAWKAAEAKESMMLAIQEARAAYPHALWAGWPTYVELYLAGRRLPIGSVAMIVIADYGCAAHAVTLDGMLGPLLAVFRAGEPVDADVYAQAA